MCLSNVSKVLTSLYIHYTEVVITTEVTEEPGLKLSFSFQDIWTLYGLTDGRKITLMTQPKLRDDLIGYSGDVIYCDRYQTRYIFLHPVMLLCKTRCNDIA